MNKKAIVPVKTLDEIKRELTYFSMSTDPNSILRSGHKEITGMKPGPLNRNSRCGTKSSCSDKQ
ncbi:hypothetical protein HY310_00745 [Candidatus Microgenomates bacterium]|nr:hypothetical protein [Candidatus Microgenomates bacterium]